jgi:hypothetical protein
MSNNSFIVLCGSIKFKEEFMRYMCHFSKLGYIVLLPSCFEGEYHHKENLSKEMEDKFTELHKKRIDLANIVFIINKGGYIGKATREEIEYAKRKGKKIIYAEIGE